MSDDQRVYSDEEFALILREVAELRSNAEPRGGSSSGLTLTEMKAIAAQVGLDPDLVERAARRLVATEAVSAFGRLIGGPVRHTREVRFPIELDDDRTALLLSAVRVSAGQAGRQDAEHSSAMGTTWRDGGVTEALSMTARRQEDDTVVSVVLDRRGTFGAVAVSSGVAAFFAVLFAAFALYPEAPALGYGGLIAGIGSVLAVARGYWASSTRTARERMSVVMDAIGQALSQQETQAPSQPETQASGLATVGDGAAAANRDASEVVDAEPTGA